MTENGQSIKSINKLKNDQIKIFIEHLKKYYLPTTDITEIFDSLAKKLFDLNKLLEN